MLFIKVKAKFISFILEYLNLFEERQGNIFCYCCLFEELEYNHQLAHNAIHFHEIFVDNKFRIYSKYFSAELFKEIIHYFVWFEDLLQNNHFHMILE